MVKALYLKEEEEGAIYEELVLYITGFDSQMARV